MNPGASMGPPEKRSPVRFILLLFGLSIPLWVLGAIYDVSILPDLKLYQLPLAMPMVAALILIHREDGSRGLFALLKRTYDVRNIKPLIWYAPILLLFPSIGFANYWMLRFSGVSIPPPHFSWDALLGYSAVFFMTYGEELGLTGYAIDPMQRRHGAFVSGVLLGLVWAGYHIPGFIISGYYSLSWILWHALYTIAGRVLFVWIYSNSGKSLFSMALLHWTFGLFWILWPVTGNLQKALPFYDPRICALVAIGYVVIATSLWGSRTLAHYRFSRVARPDSSPH